MPFPILRLKNYTMKFLFCYQQDMLMSSIQAHKHGKLMKLQSVPGNNAATRKETLACVSILVAAFFKQVTTALFDYTKEVPSEKKKDQGESHAHN